MSTPAEPLPPPEPQVSTKVMTRIIIALIALWDLAAGLVLLAFHGASSGALGVGVREDAGQRLVGVQMLVLVPAYLLIAWRPQRYGGFLWLPFVAQLSVVLVVGYSIITGETDFGDGILAVAVGIIFVALLGFIWMTEQRTVARQKMDEAAARDAAASAPPQSQL